MSQCLVHIGHCIINSDSGGGDFPGDPVGKTLLHNAGGAGSIPDWGARIPTCPLGQKNKTENRSNIVTNSIKTKKKKKSPYQKSLKKQQGKLRVPPPSPHSEATGISYWGLFCPPSMRSPGAGSPPGSSPCCGLASVPSAPT